MNDSKIESIDITDFLRSIYKDDIDTELAKVVFSQTDDDVWITVTKECNTEFGIKRKIQTVNLDFCAEPFEEDEKMIHIGSEGVEYSRLSFSATE